MGCMSILSCTKCKLLPIVGWVHRWMLAGGGDSGELRPTEKLFSFVSHVWGLGRLVD